MTPSETLKAHPDYKSGYEAALAGEPIGFVSEAFDAGSAAARDAQRILAENGFTRTGPATFSKRTEVRASLNTSSQEKGE